MCVNNPKLGMTKGMVDVFAIQVKFLFNEFATHILFESMRPLDF